MNIDSILDTGLVRVETRVKRYDIDFAACWGTKWHNEDDIETNEVVATDDDLTYDALIQLKTPIHYWRLGEASTATPPLDEGSLSQAGTWGAGTVVAQTGLLTTDLDTAAQFGNSTSHYVNVAGFQIPCLPVTGPTYTGYVTEYTQEFLIRLDADFIDSQFIMGQLSSLTASGGYDFSNGFGSIQLSRESSKNYLVVNKLPVDYGNSNSAVRTELQSATTYHIAVTYKDGNLTLYKNGTAIMTKHILDTIPAGLPTFSGYPYADVTKAFRIGYAPDYGVDVVSQTFTLDEVAIYDQALSESEIRRHYIKMRDGYSDTGGDPGPGDPACDNTTLPALINEEDVSQYVVMDTLTLTRGDDTQVDMLSFNVVEEWGEAIISDMFNANTYLIVERRYWSLDGSIDSAWEALGHYVCEGPYGVVHDAQNRMYQVSAKGLLKFLSLDIPIFTKLEPDKVLVSRREMTDVSTGTEYKSYKVDRVGFTGLYYQNFAVFPTPKLWISDFTTVGDIVTGADVLRAKGAEESVQFVYGDGTFRVDLDYFSGKVSEQGFGAPDTIEIEAYRHLVPEDIADGIITDTEVVLDGADIVEAIIRIAQPTAGIIGGETYVGRTLFLTSGLAKGYMYRIVGFTDETTAWAFSVISYTGGSVPDIEAEGVAVADTIRIGDCNSPAQALTKIFLFAGFQNTDSTKPFYFEFVEPIFDGGITLAPQKFGRNDGKSWLQITKEILDQCPGNYKLIVDRSGVARTLNVIQKIVGSADHTLSKVTSIEQDGSDYGVFTRVIASGQFLDPTDVGLSTAAGGDATYGAYKLTNFTSADPEGDTLSQNDADTIVNQIANHDPKTPIGPASDDDNDTYGCIWRVFGTMAVHGFDCRRWSMEDSNLFWIDLGRDSSDKQYLIDSFEIQVFPVMLQIGTIIQQTLQIYYMTEQDYIAYAGSVPPAASGDATVETNLLAMPNSPAWRALTSEFVTGEGITDVNSNDFPDGVPVKMRFIKFVCGQPCHHPELDGTKYENTPISVIAMAGLRIYTSQEIIQVAELGVTPPFDTQEFRDIARRLRRRTLYLEPNPYIQSTKTAEDFSLQELKEHYTEFEPLSVGAIAPTVELWDTVEWTNPETGVTQTYVVKSLNLKNNEFCNLQIIDYVFFSDS